MGIFCAHSGLRWDGVAHGFLPGDKRYCFLPFGAPLLILERRLLCVAVRMLDIPLPAFHMCALNAPLWTEWAYVALVGISGAYLPLGWNLNVLLTDVHYDQTWQLSPVSLRS